MKQAVIVKGNIHKGAKGINVILDEKMPFTELCEEVALKFRELKEFFKESHMVIDLEGRELSTDEQKKILDIITENSDIKVLYLLEHDENKEAYYSEKMEEKETSEEKEIHKEPENMFYKGTLRSGQVVESDSSIVIIGDVNPGGKVISGGNIIILGSLKGIACAGIKGNSKAFVVALEMKPTQIRIDNVVAKGTEPERIKKRLRRKKVEESVPKIALLIDDNIIVESLEKETLSKLF